MKRLWGVVWVLILLSWIGGIRQWQWTMADNDCHNKGKLMAGGERLWLDQDDRHWWDSYKWITIGSPKGCLDDLRKMPIPDSVQKKLNELNPPGGQRT